MVSHTDEEPKPRVIVEANRVPIVSQSRTLLPRQIEQPRVDFFDTLDSRQSSTGGLLETAKLSSLLWHSMRLRERRPGRFGIGRESRSAPSAGGLHPIRLIVMSIDGVDSGIYDDHSHALLPISARAIELNRVNIAEIFGISTGTTIQFAADAGLVSACYENPSSLIWRDAGALAATMCLIATTLCIAATPVGRVGNAIVEAANLPDGFIGAGAVHFGGLPFA